ncbi:MAG TPA: hypothetical protein VHX99_01225 [Rhizomicrobium sp.]|jgi:hypothetical protein|nr:hypothetical protein [Rhizomicrobium sp.]
MSSLALDNGAKAPPAADRSRVFALVLPALAATAYPFLLSAISWLLRASQVTAPPSPLTITVTVLAILISVSAVMGVAFARALSLGRIGAGTSGRLLAHLAFTAPSLLVGFGNVAGLLHARGAVVIAWPLFWLAVMALAWLALDAPQSAPPITATLASRRLAVAHGVSALAILILFVLPHLADHLAGIVSGAAHIQVMKLARLDYRNVIIEPLLLTLIVFQIMSGFVLVRRKLARASDAFGTLQTMTGVYVGIYLLAHMTAAFSARGAGTDTNWNWLTYDDQGLLSHLDSFTLVAHYWVGPIAIIAHLACGLRVVMLEHGVSLQAAGRLAEGLIGLGVVASSVILAGLLGVHIA